MPESPSQPQTKGKIPKSVPYIIGNEAAERFNFYGLRAILTTFLAVHFFNPEQIKALDTVANAKANEYVHLFATLAYFMPLLGGIAADWFFGKYKVILYVSILYAIGNLILALGTDNLGFFLTGLITIAVAAGGIKSCVSANVGDQFDQSNQHLLSKVYGWFYFAINTGGTLSPILIPIIYEKYKYTHPGIAFGVPGLLMVIATIVFWLGRKKYVRVPPTGIKKENVMSISWYALKKVFNRKRGQKVWDAVGEKYKASSIDGVKAVYRILIVFSFTVIYWAMWDQNLSEWILQATKLDLSINLHWFHFSLLPEQINAMNPIFVLCLIPVFTYGLYPLFEKMGIKPTPLRKIGAGLFLIGASFVIIAMIQTSIDHGGKPSVFWQILAYFLLAASEVLVSITCLEYAYTQSPPSMKSTMSALYLLGISLGSLFDTIVNASIANHGFFYREGASFYWFFLEILAGFIILYLLVAKRIPEKSYLIEKPQLAS